MRAGWQIEIMKETMCQGIGVQAVGPVSANEFVSRGIDSDGQDFGRENISEERNGERGESRFEIGAVGVVSAGYGCHDRAHPLDQTGYVWLHRSGHATASCQMSP